MGGKKIHRKKTLCDTQLLHGLIDSSGGCWAGGLVSKFFLHFFHQVLCANVVDLKWGLCYWTWYHSTLHGTPML